MHRRSFIQFPAVAMAAGAATTGDIPNYHVVSPYKAEGKPNRYPGRVVSAPMQPTAESVAASIAASMKKLTNTKDAREAFLRLKRSTETLVAEIKKSTRFSVSVLAIESSNTLIRLARFLRLKN